MPNPEFVFTLNDAVAWFLAVCAGIACISGAVAALTKFGAFLKKPNKEQDDKIEETKNEIIRLTARVENLESDSKKFSELFEKDKRRLDAHEESTNMLLKANFALLGHALNGNNVEQMQGAFNEIQEYLFNR